MIYYKMCDCGFRNIFEDLSFIPRKCEECKRSLEGRPIQEFDETVEETVVDEIKEVVETCESGLFYIQDIHTEECDDIPVEGGLLGRAHIGWRIFQKHPSVSRAHIEVSYYKNLGLRIKDISTYGTYLNDEKLTKNSMETVFEGDVIKLYDCEVVIKRK